LNVQLSITPQPKFESPGIKPEYCTQPDMASLRKIAFYCLSVLSATVLWPPARPRGPDRTGLRPRSSCVHLSSPKMRAWAHCRQHFAPAGLLSAASTNLIVSQASLQTSSACSATGKRAIHIASHGLRTILVICLFRERKL
jgi:hypothetical protein